MGKSVKQRKNQSVYTDWSGYQKGKDRNKIILKEATNLLINSGYYNFSMRKVAIAANITVGNLQHYYPTKELLVQAMLEDVISPYLEEWGVIRHVDKDPRDQFKHIVEQVIRDLKTKKTTRLFPELWSLANHEKDMNKYMDAMYGKFRNVLAELILLINPVLNEKQAKRMALFISSSIEGHTMFIGYQKPWTRETENIVKIATDSFLWIIDNNRIPAE